MTRRQIIIALAICIVLISGATRWLTSSSENRTETVTVGQLWKNADQYEGKRVRTTGVVRLFAPGSDEYFVIEQANQYRMGLRNRPNSELESLVDRTISVEGVVHFQEGFGWYINVDELELQSSANS